MEKYEKPVMEIDETEEDIILASCTDDVKICSGIFGYGGGSGGGGAL